MCLEPAMMILAGLDSFFRSTPVNSPEEGQNKQ